MDIAVIRTSEVSTKTPCLNCSVHSDVVDTSEESVSDVVVKDVVMDEETDDLDVTEETPNYENVYMRACTMFKVTPSNCYLKQLSNLNVSMQNRTLGDSGIKAIATALVVSGIKQNLKKRPLAA